MPLTRNRAGFTLVELLIAIVLVGLVGVIIVRLLADTQRLTVAQGERAMLQSTTRTGVLVVPAELREINSAMGDITTATSSSIVYRGMRTMGVTCGAPAAGIAVVDNGTIQGLGSFEAADSVLVFVENDPTTADDDTWALSRLGAVAPGVCPNGDAGTTLTFVGTMAVFDWATGLWNGPAPVLGNAAVIRKFEQTQLTSYQDGNGDTWLGMSVEGNPLEPIAGPLADADGLRFDYVDAGGNPTMTPGAIAAVQITVVGVTSRAVREGQNPLAFKFDSLTTRVALRNSF